MADKGTLEKPTSTTGELELMSKGMKRYTGVFLIK